MITLRRILVMAFALTVGACAYESSGVTTTTIADPNALPPATGPADLVFEDQLTEGSSVIITSISLPEEGFVALYADESGVPGEIIGVSDRLSAGVIGNVSVPLFIPIDGDTTIHAVAHVDMDRDGAFTFEPPDGFVDVPATFANGETASVVATVGLLPPLAPADVVLDPQRTVGATVVIESATLPAAGFVAVWTDADGEPGRILGISELLAGGTHREVTVPLDDRLAVSATLWAQVVVDRDGDGAFGLEGPGGEDRIGLRVDGTAAADSAQVTAVPRSPTVLVAADQESEGAQVVVGSVTMPSPGFVVVRADVDGDPGETLAVSGLLDRATHRDVVLVLDPPVTVPVTLWIEVRVDLSGDGELGDDDVMARVEGGDPARVSVVLTEPTNES